MHHCDEACRKLIINSGFMAPIAAQLAGHSGTYAAAAQRLFAAATLHNSIVEVAEAKGILTASTKTAFHGCEQAKALLGWARKPPTESEAPDVITKMNEWADLLFANALAIVSDTTNLAGTD